MSLMPVFKYRRERESIGKSFCRWYDWTVLCDDEYLNQGITATQSNTALSVPRVSVVQKSFCNNECLKPVKLTMALTI